MRREGRPNFTGWRSGERWPEERRIRELTSWIPIHLVPALTRCVRRLVLHRSLTLPSGHGDRRQPTLGGNKPSVWLIEAAFLVLVFDDLRQPIKLACQRCPALRDTHERGGALD